MLATGAGYHFKAEAARSELEGVGTPDYEALFASNEGVKQPTVLAAGAGYN
ncbi:NADH dehydrogenase [Bacillus cereus]|nr:NADH dehydrogenase [Bacillus cereus]